MRSLPGQEDLHHDQHKPGLLNLLHQTVDATMTYTEGDADDDDVRRAPDLQLGSYLGSRPLIGRIIFEVAYSESLVHARRKAKYYLCEADQPRPSVMVLCNFTETARKKEFGEERRDMKLYFEVLRCDFSNQSETRKYETGVSLFLLLNRSPTTLSIPLPLTGFLQCFSLFHVSLRGILADERSFLVRLA